jgi:hypothetical protein
VKPAAFGPRPGEPYVSIFIEHLLSRGYEECLEGQIDENGKPRDQVVYAFSASIPLEDLRLPVKHEPPPYPHGGIYGMKADPDGPDDDEYINRRAVIAQAARLVFDPKGQLPVER